MPDLIVPAYIRGELVEGPLVEFGGRGGDASFMAPDPMTLVDRLALRSPSLLSDLYGLSFDDILDYLVELGDHLRLDRNPLMREALEASVPFSDLTRPLLQSAYETAPDLFRRDRLIEHAERSVGIDHLEGWVEHPRLDGRTVGIRAFGSRTLHIIAGNSPWMACLTIVRCALARCDAIIKLPSNDPMTAGAIARTMAQMAPDHPITKHLAVAYWKGGHIELEQQLYDPNNVEKIVAWGGFASVKHVTKYIQPGLELISLDPKRSATVIGPEAFDSDEATDEVAARAAADIGMMNQNACSSARVVYVLSGSDEDGVERCNELGEKIYAKMLALPQEVSTPVKSFDPEVRSHLKALLMDDEYYKVIGRNDGRGAIIVSQEKEAVDWAPKLNGRVANLVPIDSIDEAIREMNSYTQSVGVYPDSLKAKIRDALAIQGAQRIMSLGYVITSTEASPQDGIEPMRRMVRWITDDTCVPETTPAAWEAVLGAKAEAAE